jgi:hypothetical protein
MVYVQNCRTDELMIYKFSVFDVIQFQFMLTTNNRLYYMLQLQISVFSS